MSLRRRSTGRLGLFLQPSMEDLVRQTFLRDLSQFGFFSCEGQKFAITHLAVKLSEPPPFRCGIKSAHGRE